MTRRKSTLAAVTVLAAVLISGCARGGAVNSWVAPPMPVVKMPKPNAFDYFVAAGKMIRDSKAIAACFGPTSHVSSKEEARLVKENGPALAKLREGFKHEYRFPFRYGIDAAYPELRQFKALAMLLRLEGRVKSAHGDWGGAVDSWCDAMLLGETTPVGCMIGASLSGMGCENMGRWEIQKAVDHLGVSETRRALRRMSDINARRIPFEKILTWQKEFELASFSYEFSGKCKDPMVKDWPKLPGFIKRRVVTEYTGILDQQIRTARQPYARKLPGPVIKSSGDPRYVPADAIIAVLYPDFTHSRFMYTLHMTYNRLLEVTLALHAYKLDHKTYPRRLGGLCPNYLKALPADPFALKGTFGYKLNGDKYVLWSLGPDCRDNGGKPICDTKETDTGRRYYPKEESVGDVVAGVNDL